MPLGPPSPTQEPPAPLYHPRTPHTCPPPSYKINSLTDQGSFGQAPLDHTPPLPTPSYKMNSLMGKDPPHPVPHPQ